MQQSVTDYYDAAELFNDDLEVMAYALILIRNKQDKTRPNIIKKNVNDACFEFLHKYTRKLCDMKQMDFAVVKMKAEHKIAQQRFKEQSLFWSRREE